ncbi:hypothetical protein [Nannocystis pusilla]|uniref:Uncharacterized protein n=1 Tax=Nannocystis pusilla TaxID=889268 RepID=A0ABS7TQE6_9BACT|nr:hypothetical protein [Nannocystis pusilla]MBZ5710459.1 hypothetical protein [Nannocystis pusilla]
MSFAPPSPSCALRPLLVVTLGLWAMAAPSEAHAVEVSLVPPSVPGVTCVNITYDCVEPSFVEVSVDATIAGTYTPGLDIFTVPRSICFTEAAYGGGIRVIAVEADCEGQVPKNTTDSVSTTFANPPVGLEGIEDEQVEWSAGDTISILVHAQDEDLDVAVDFSAVASDYMPGDEIVTDLGGGDYEVDYTLSVANTRSAGEYRLPVEISDGTVSRTYSDAVLVRYTPSPTGVIEFQDVLNGDFVFRDMPTGIYTGVSLTSALIRPQPGALAKVFAEIWSENNLDGTALILNAREAGTDGYASTEVWISGSTCSSTPPIGCIAEFEVPLTIRPSRMDDVADEDEIDVELSLGLYTPTGPVFTVAALVPIPWLVDKQPANTIAMSGRLLYERLRQGAKEDINNPNHPEYAILEVTPEVNPVRRVTIEVTDACSHTYTTRTSETGFWQTYVPKECANTTYSLKARPTTSNFGIYRVRTRDFDDLVPVIEIATASVPGTTKAWGTEYFDFSSLSVGEFRTFMAGLRVQEWAKPYLVGDAKVSSFPWLSIRYEGGAESKPSCAPTSCYTADTEIVHVNAGNSNDDSQDEFTLLHECFHWFQHMFMARLDGNGSPSTYAWAGAFGEGFASMMPAVLRGDRWAFRDLNFGNEGKGYHDAELLDFQGTFTLAGNIANNWFPALPYDLYNTENDKGSGGWSWRLLWDFFDDSDLEPEHEFARYDADGTSDISASNPPVVDYGLLFDDIGSAAIFQDVIVRYLGGNHMPANTSRPGLDTRGGLGLDMTEFLDGILCRGHHEWEDIEWIVHDVMDFAAYDPANAPTSCP